MKRKLFMIAAFVALHLVAGILVFIFFVSQPSQSAQSNDIDRPADSKVNKDITIVYDDAGFSPSEVNIEKGTTIKFDNRTETPMWAASNPHPDHTDYSEFDMAKALGRLPKIGEDFSFKFDKVGTWRYHSHTASGDETDVGVHLGVVTVK